MILKGQFFIFHNIAASQLGCNISDFYRLNVEFSKTLHATYTFTR